MSRLHLTSHTKMVEKKFVVYELRLGYNGPVKIEDFYKEVENWIKSKDMDKETKRKMERLTAKGKKLEWTIECSKEITNFAKGVVRMRSMFNNVREIQVKKKGRKIKTQQAEVLILLDGILETDLSQKWEQKPTFHFLRMLIDKFIWKFYTERYDGIPAADTHELHKTLQAFFNLEKIKYQ